MTQNNSGHGRTVRVTDPSGRDLQPTWPKRAAGLVKKGRAFRVSEDHIQFIDTINADIPSDNSTKLSEEYIMSQENAANIEVNETAAESKLTADYILDKIERIDNDMQYLYDAIKAIGEIPSGTDAGPMGDVSGMEKAKALADIVRCRETTKQKLLDFYTGLLDDLRKQDRNHKKDALEILRAAVESDSDDKNSLVEQVNYALDAVRHIDN